MRVLLISSNIARTPYPVYPLGMSMIAAAARQDGHQVEFLDFLQSGQSWPELAERLRRFRPQVVGVSVRNVDNVNLINQERYLELVVEIVQAVKRQSQARIILGGTAFSIFPELLLARTGGDYGVVGEGEALFRQFLAAASRGAWPEPGTILRSSPSLQGQAIPSAIYNQPLLEHYLQNGGVASVQTKRGCPLNCVYCSYPSLEGNRIRSRDPRQVVDDMERLAERNRIDSVFFTDSVFNDDQNSYLEVVRELERRQLQVGWSAFFKPSGITAELVSLLKKTGLRSVEMGSDAATDQTLRGQNKNFTWAEVEEANRLFMAARIPVANYFMFGGPAETRSTVRTGIKHILALACTVSFVFMGIRILPDTELYQIALREGVIAPDNDLLEPVYYIAPGIDRSWLEASLTEAFADSRRIMFPPDRFDRRLQILHKLGYTGALWEMLDPGSGQPPRSVGPVNDGRNLG